MLNTILPVASQLALAGIGALAFTSITSRSAFAAPMLTLKASFNLANGAIPNALTPAGNGLFYGTAAYGGDNDLGSIFEFDPSGGGITLKASFDLANGAGVVPFAALTPAGNGLFYGTTLGGGDNGFGSIFEFDSSGGGITLKASFDGANGKSPYAGLTSAGNGLFYGTAAEGGDNDLGSIFEFDPSGGGITLKASFDGANGKFPYAGLTSAGNGLFFGTAARGGDNGFGSIFEFDPSGGGITLKASFDLANGNLPYAGLTSAGNGLFYGTTLEGGHNNLGSIFEFDPSGAVPVPGPLPLMGATAAFGWSRKLRRRIQQVRPVFPIGR
jgi:uncharacterized repeat protein (TIGR03803 family)